MATSDLAARIAAIKQTAADAQRLAGQCSSAQDFARTTLTQIDQELTAIGVNPENADADLSALEAQLEATVTEIEGKLAAEVAELNRIYALARQAQLVR